MEQVGGHRLSLGFHGQSGQEHKNCKRIIILSDWYPGYQTGLFKSYSSCGNGKEIAVVKLWLSVGFIS